MNPNFSYTDRSDLPWRSFFFSTPTTQMHCEKKSKPEQLQLCVSWEDDAAGREVIVLTFKNLLIQQLCTRFWKQKVLHDCRFLARRNFYDYDFVRAAKYFFNLSRGFAAEIVLIRDFFIQIFGRRKVRYFLKWIKKTSGTHKYIFRVMTKHLYLCRIILIFNGKFLNLTFSIIFFLSLLPNHDTSI